MQGKINQAVFAVLAMLTFWVVIHTVKLNTIVPDYDMLNRTINTLMNRIIGVEEFVRELKEKAGKLEHEKLYENQLDSFKPFEQKFKEMRIAYGAGHVFNWNGERFTTYYAEETTNNR